MESAENGHHYHHSQPFIDSSSTTNSSNFSYGVVSNTTTSHSWVSSNQSHPSTNEFHYMDFHFPQRIKHEEFSSFYYPNFTEMLTSNLHSDDCDRGFVHNFSNISSCLNQIGVAEANSFGMTLEALDHLGTSQISANGLIPYCPLNYTPQSNQPQLSSLSDKVTDSCIKEAKVDHQKHKKPRLEARSCRPPLKVRKEKLGDRIAALQQLVAPFGKTDTASVLMEAIGYIKFLQDQVETLSVLYMKAPGSNHIAPFKQGADDEEVACDLRSRGLCLVPVSWLSCIAETS